MDPSSLVLPFHLSNPNLNEGSDKGTNWGKHVREVGEMRFVAIDIQLPSGLGTAPGHKSAQMNW